MTNLTFLQQMERIWRLVATGISFFTFGLGGLFLTATIFPLLNIFVRNRTRRERLAQHVVHLVWKRFVWLMIVLGVIELEIQDGDLLSADTGTLVIANHPTLIDVVLIMALMRRTQCLVKPGVWANPFMRGVVKATNYIPNLGDTSKLVDDCVAALNSGNNLVIFPEGSRTTPGEKPVLTRGFANIAIRANAPVRLVCIRCTPPTLRKGEKWYRVPSRRPLFRLEVRELIEAGAFQAAGGPSRSVRELSAYVARRYGELNAYG
jgi:1-acyl-sn-glycerol-3-phosphate acyltransferase